MAFTVRGSDINLIAKYKTPGMLNKYCVNKCHAIITVCQALKDQIVNMDLSEEHVFVVRNGVDLELFKLLNKKIVRKKYKRWNAPRFVLSAI